MGTQIPGIPQTATGVSLTNHINDRLRRISLALDGAAGTPGATGATGAPGTSGGAVSTAVTRRGKAVMFGTNAASTTLAALAGNHLSIDMNGAVGDCLTVADATMSSSSSPTHLSSATAGFTVLDIGKPVLVVGAGASGAGLQGTIVSISSPTLAVLSASCATSVTGAEATWGTDNTAAINAVLATAAALNASVLIPEYGYLVTGTIALYPHTKVYGTWGGTPHDGLNDSGSFLFYAGPPNTVVLSALGVAGTVFSGLGVNGGNNAISGVTCFLYDSGTANAPQGNRTVLEQVSLYNAGLITYTTLRGTRVPASIDGTGLQLGNSGVLGYQSDTIVMRDWYIGNCGTGIDFNSFNTAQNSEFSHGEFFFCQDCVKFTLAPGLLLFSSIAFGLLEIPGTICNAFNCSDLQGPITILNCESEGGYGDFLYLPASNGANPTITLIGNDIGHDSVVDNQSQIVSIGNTFSGRDFASLFGTGGQICSTGDTFQTFAGPFPYSAGTAEVTSGSTAVLFDPVTTGFDQAPLLCKALDRGTICFEGQAVTAGTKANPVVFTVPGGAPSSGPIYMSGLVDSNWGQLNGWETATKLTSTTFSVPVDTSGFSTSFSGTPFVCLAPYILTATSNASGTIAKVVGSSTTPLTPDINFKVVTTQSGLGFSPGDAVQLVDDSTGGIVYLTGTVSSYSSTTLVMLISGVTLGSAAIGTFSRWSVVRPATGFAGTTNATQAYYVTRVPTRAFVGWNPVAFINLSPQGLSLPNVATLGTPQTLSNKAITTYTPGILDDDTLGNLPSSFPIGVSSYYVSSVSTFPGGQLGFVSGYINPGVGVMFQTYYDYTTAGYYFRFAAAGGNVWAAWVLLNPAILPPSGGGTGVASIAALFALLTAPEVEAALTFTPAAAFSGYTGSVALAKLTPVTGANGSLTVANGIITAYSAPT